jgi:hypothetical protein
VHLVVGHQKSSTLRPSSCVMPCVSS